MLLLNVIPDACYFVTLLLFFVPGLGLITVDNILERRKQSRIMDLSGIGKLTRRLQKAQKYLTF
jgi:predicted DNA-binding helix-hairpin-helix protein